MAKNENEKRKTAQQIWWVFRSFSHTYIYSALLYRTGWKKKWKTTNIIKLQQ